MRILLFLYIIVLPCTARAQGKHNGQPKDTAIQYDAYKNTERAEVLLQHCPYSDEGNFVLKEKGKPLVKGNWTVLRGSATDRNATVIELATPGRSWYYLRMLSGDAYELDSTLHKLLPESAHYFTKEKFHPGIQKEFTGMEPLKCSL